jgi:hypothetical protein
MRTRKKFKISEPLGRGIEVSYVPSISSVALDLRELANQNNVNRSRLVRIITAYFKKKS